MRDAVLARVREALSGRDRLPHPGEAPRRGDVIPPNDSLADEFTARFEAAGGRVVRLANGGAAAAWARELASSFTTACQSPLLDPQLRLPLPHSDAESADLGVSVAIAAAAETGSLVLTSREGRRLQLLPPSHLVWIPTDRLDGSLEAALERARSDETAALALHSGPSKSADIGRIVVTGVHAPANVIAALVG